MNEIKFYMQKDLAAVDLNSSVFSATEVMAERRIGAIFVSENEEIVGIFSETDLLRKIVSKKMDPEKIKISEVMSKPIISLDQESLMVAAFLKIQKEKIRHLGVTKQSKIVGVLSIRDVANYYVLKFSPS
jgi:CBS domain-containing protein